MSLRIISLLKRGIFVLSDWSTLPPIDAKVGRRIMEYPDTAVESSFPLMDSPGLVSSGFMDHALDPGSLAPLWKLGTLRSFTDLRSSAAQDSARVLLKPQLTQNSVLRVFKTQPDLGGRNEDALFPKDLCVGQDIKSSSSGLPPKVQPLSWNTGFLQNLPPAPKAIAIVLHNDEEANELEGHRSSSSFDLRPPPTEPTAVFGTGPLTADPECLDDEEFGVSRPPSRKRMISIFSRTSSKSGKIDTPNSSFSRIIHHWAIEALSPNTMLLTLLEQSDPKGSGLNLQQMINALAGIANDLGMITRGGILGSSMSLWLVEEWLRIIVILQVVSLA
ncbi:hypothetical protein BT96DRAFT_1008057 [Gymnopus androsaceus JB14]|uniref:Uncharacterized protein n=1 Tax=Gymnopus androsaceus JB14 TaxID=1447944 RepID=A0A6A4GG54_9AGAR|nr:hypothetical protein BT96DRAFT_1008057 [Gymnopus androsaceus JB14]